MMAKRLRGAGWVATLVLAGCSGTKSGVSSGDAMTEDATTPDDGQASDAATVPDAVLADAVPDLAVDATGGDSDPPPDPALLPPTPLGPDLLGTVDAGRWTAQGGSALSYDVAHRGFAFTTDAMGSTNHEDWQKSIRSPSAPLRAGHAYQFVLRIATDVFPRGQNVMVTARDGSDSSQSQEFAWNVSRAGAFEEVVVPVFPVHDGPWRVDVWVSPTLKYASTPSTIFVDPDLDLFELPLGVEVATIHGIDPAKDKDAFESATERIDGLGNVYVRRSGSWTHVFPKMLYRGTDANELAMFQKYKDYGFNGVMDVWTGATAQAVVDAGLEFVSINANSDTNAFSAMQPYIERVYQWAETTGRHANVLWYNYDNENASIAAYDYQQQLQAYVDAHHVDPTTGRRRHPIYYLNGNIGLPRTYRNADRTAIDLTGSYVGNFSAVGQTADIPPVPTLATEFATQNQRAPVSVIQLQAYLNEHFVPALFYGLIMGGRALSVWRDGTTFGGAQPDFRDNVWASAFKTEVSPRLDQMLPLLEQPHFTPWKAWTEQFPTVRIGTRDLAGAGYLILSNLGDQDVPVTVHIEGRAAARAVDMFTGEAVGDLVGGVFSLTLGHHNAGYRVLRLVTP